MNDIFSVYLGERVVGSMQVKTCGLYYEFCCHCDLRTNAAFTVEACCGENKINLGICVPCGEAFGLKTRVPIKRLGTGEWYFTAKPRTCEVEAKFYPLREDAPFDHIHRLRNGYLVNRDGQMGVIFKDESQIKL